MATVTNNNDFNLDEYTINEYKDSDYYDDKYYNKYYQSMEYLEGLEALDDYVNNARYDEEFDLSESHLKVLGIGKGMKKKEKAKAKYAALPLLQQIQHFIKVEKKQRISEKKRMDSMYLHNKRVAKQADSVKYVNEEVDDVVLMKDSYWEEIDEFLMRDSYWEEDDASYWEKDDVLDCKRPECRWRWI